MDVATVNTMISSVGFPIAMCLFMAWYIQKKDTEQRNEIQKLNEEHRAEMNDIISALNNNTLALEKLCTILGVSDDDKKNN